MAEIHHFQPKRGPGTPPPPAAGHVRVSRPLWFSLWAPQAQNPHNAPFGLCDLLAWGDAPFSTPAGCPPVLRCGAPWEGPQGVPPPPPFLVALPTPGCRVPGWRMECLLLVWCFFFLSTSVVPRAPGAGLGRLGGWVGCPPAPNPVPSSPPAPHTRTRLPQGATRGSEGADFRKTAP